VNDWDSWVDVQMVVSAGSAIAVGEPTVTKYGDLSFVVVTQNVINGTNYDMYDADPWLLLYNDNGRCMTIPSLASFWQ